MRSWKVVARLVNKVKVVSSWRAWATSKQRRASGNFSKRRVNSSTVRPVVLRRSMFSTRRRLPNCRQRFGVKITSGWIMMFQPRWLTFCNDLRTSASCSLANELGAWNDTYLNFSTGTLSRSLTRGSNSSSLNADSSTAATLWVTSHSRAARWSHFSRAPVENPN